jgi:SAM-dependent methyltransferase
MDPKHLAELIAVEKDYWWHKAKRELVVDILLRNFPPPARLIEGGVGGGNNLLAFQKLGYEVLGLDIMPEAVAHCRQLGIKSVRVHNLEDPWPVTSGTTRVVVLLDVLEHLTNPTRVLRHGVDSLDEGGGFVISVPAHPIFKGPWDEMLGHRRRYTKGRLIEQARESGLRVSWLSYWNAFSLPLALYVRTIQALFSLRVSQEFSSVPVWVNRGLTYCADIERRLIRNMPIPLGLSIIGVLRK